MPRRSKLPPREILAVAPPGLEALVALELEAMGWSPARATAGGVLTTGGLAQVMRGCLWSRTAAGLRVRVGRSPAGSLDALAQGLRKLPFQLFLRPGQPIQVSVTSKRSRLRRREAVARKAQLAIRDALRGPRHPHQARPRRGERTPTVHLRIQDDRVQVSVDPVGGALWQRGYRRSGGAAPLRANLAAALLLQLAWAPPEPLVDAFTGSGTFLIEAAGWALGRAPGSGRGFAFEGWPCHDGRLWRQVQQQRMQAPGPPGALLGLDADPGAIERATQNAGEAGVGAHIRWRRSRVDALEPPGTQRGLVVANPPWGRRLGQDVRGVYTALGSALQARFPGWRLGLLCPRRELVRCTGLALNPELEFAHAGERLSLWVGRVPVG